MERGRLSGTSTETADAALRTERSIALLRAGVLIVATGIYVASIGIRRSIGPLALSILAVAAVYSLWMLLARPYERYAPARFGAAALVLDAGLITLWCYGTGGPRSEFWTLYLMVIISVAMRYDVLEVVGSALGLAALYVAVMAVGGGLPASSLLLRPTLILMTGFAVGVLARQRRTSQEERAVMEGLAEERRRALAEEQAFVERLRQVDLAKTEFVAVAAHEFRTPLAAIVGVLGTMLTRGDSLDPAVKAELLEGASAQARRLSRLVEDLLTVSRIENGALPIELRIEDAEHLVMDAVRSAGMENVTSVELNGVEWVTCDADRLVRVLTNLLDNARKYSPPGATVSLTVGCGDGVVRFAVADRGPGIPSEQRERVFDRFRRLTDSSETPGTGLGLYIARGLVEAHGGIIRVDEAEGGGAEFVFTIPIPEDPGPAERQAPVDSPLTVS